MRIERDRPLRVIVLGHGSIGRPVARALAAGTYPQVELIGVLDSGGGWRMDTGGRFSLNEVPQLADLVVEAANQRVLSDVGPRLLGAGVDVLVVSVGALSVPATRRSLMAGPGRLFVSSGAIGGLDLIRSVAESGTLRSVTIETTKLPATLEQDWMTAEQRSTLLGATGRVELMRGSAATIALAFPKSANVAAAVALATGSWDCVEAIVSADARLSHTTHDISVDSGVGQYRFEIKNLPSQTNPATSALVPHAVLRTIGDIAGRLVQPL